MQSDINLQPINHQKTKSELDKKETTGVSYKVYLNYFKAGRGQIFLGLFLLFLGIGQVYMQFLFIKLPFTKMTKAWT